MAKLKTQFSQSSAYGILVKTEKDLVNREKWLMEELTRVRDSKAFVQEAIKNLEGGKVSE